MTLRNASSPPPSQPDPSDEPQWLERLRSGDEEAFAALFHHHYSSLCRYAWQLLRDSQAAEDAVQEVFVRLWTGREQLAIHSSLRAYLYTAVRNHALNQLRHLQVRLARSEELQATESAAAADPETILCAGEFEREVNQAIEALPAACREVFLLKKREGLSHAEIAAVQGISVNTVKTQLARALKFLLQRLPRD